MATTPRSSSPRTQRKRPGDMTGSRSQQLAAERDRDRSEEIQAEADAIEKEKEDRRSRVVDYSTKVAEPATEVELDDAVEDVAVEPVHIPDLKDTYSKDELQDAIAQAVAAALKQQRAGGGGGGEIEWNDEVEVSSKKEWIRVNYPIDDMTYGREVIDPGLINDMGVYERPPRLGNLRVLNFEEGTKYLVDKDVADHLRSLGYVYEF